MNAKEKEQVILAIEQLGRNVSVAQVAKSTGLSSNICFAALREIAAATGSTLQVVQAGEICFSFPANFVELYHAKDRSIWWDEAIRAGFDIGFFIARVVFGILLLTTIWLFHPDNPRLLMMYIVAIFCASCLDFANFEDDGAERKAKTLKNSLGFNNLAGLFSYKYRENRQNLKSELALLKDEPPPNTAGTALFNICFSYVFGDGNPNVQFENLKWRVIAEVIRQHNGAVIVEQLAPYLCCPPDDEEGMMPVIQRFNGIPRATESGNIVYLFPDLMKVEKADFRVPSYLRERPWRFSDMNFLQILPVWVVSTLLLWLSYYEFLHPDVAKSFWFDFLPPGFHMWEFVLTFSLFFFVVPALRFVYITLSNIDIEERNKLRKYFAEGVHRPDNDLFQKLLERSEFQMEEMLLEKETSDVIYTTDKTLLEQDIE